MKRTSIQLCNAFQGFMSCLQHICSWIKNNSKWLPKKKDSFSLLVLSWSKCSTTFCLVTMKQREWGRKGSQELPLSRDQQSSWAVVSDCIYLSSGNKQVNCAISQQLLWLKEGKLVMGWSAELCFCFGEQSSLHKVQNSVGCRNYHLSRVPH